MLPSISLLVHPVLINPLDMPPIVPEEPPSPLKLQPDKLNPTSEFPSLIDTTILYLLLLTPTK